MNPGVALALGVLLAGCYEDRYTCKTDAQCDLGEGGRCEVDERCTRFDPTCPTARRYAHAGAHGDDCFDDRVVPINRCAGGQPAALPEDCLAAVCTSLPACCEIAWTDACVQIAQQACSDLVCDTRIAITATRGATTELWDVTWTGTAWVIKERTEYLPPLAWVGPAPGGLFPRLAATTATELVIGDLTFPIDADRTYAQITSISVDRDRRDTFAVSHNAAGADHVIEILKGDDGSARAFGMPGSLNLTWGDLDRDHFPDAITRSGAQYFYLPNFDGDDHVRKLSFQTTVAAAGGSTPGAPGVRHIDWLDLDGDHRLDLAVFGSEVRVHTARDGLRDAAEHEVDCDPPDPTRACASAPEPNLEQASFGGAALPATDRPELVLSSFPGRKLFHAALAGDTLAVSPFPFPGDTCSCVASCTMCPGPDCSCTYDCSACLPIIAIVVRDLDGDHALDVVAIDARLNLYTAFASAAYVFGAPTQIPSAISGNFAQISTSVSGAPIP